MKETASKIILFITLSLVFISCNSQEKNDWHQAKEPLLKNKVYKQDGKTVYYFDRSIKIKDREAMINRCKGHIKDNLHIINESELSDSIQIIFTQDREENFEFTGWKNIAGIYIPPIGAGISTVLCVYGDKCPIKHELMHLVSSCKWKDVADGNSQSWLNEGLATYAAPDAECDDYSFEEKYVAILYDNKLVTIDSLVENFHQKIDQEDLNLIKIKIHYNQSAYMVQYMIENYGIEKVKELWQNGMHKFEDIFGVTIYTMVDDIEKKLREKYPEPIEFDWKKFEEKCY